MIFYVKKVFCNSHCITYILKFACKQLCPLSQHASTFFANPKKNEQEKCPGVFFVTWVPKLLRPPLKIRIFGPKAVTFAPKYAFLGTKRPCRFIWYPVAWWLWRAGCISQDAYSLYDIPYICLCCEAVKLTGLGRNKELRGLKGGRVSGGL